MLKNTSQVLTKHKCAYKQYKPSSLFGSFLFTMVLHASQRISQPIHVPNWQVMVQEEPIAKTSVLSFDNMDQIFIV